MPAKNPDVYAEDMPPASGFEMHAHDDEALLSYAAAGSCTHIIGARLWIVLPAHAVWMPPGMQHAGIIGSRGCRLRTVRFPVPIPGDLPTVPCVIEVSSFLAALVTALDKADEDETKRRDALRYLIYDEIRRSTPLELSLPTVTDARLARVTDRLQAHPSDARSLAAWAKLAGMSRRSFIRRFVEETGMGLAEWQRRLRLLVARQMLAEGMSVTQTAVALGYASASAFAAMVKRELGTTPTRLFAAGDRERLANRDREA